MKKGYMERAMERFQSDDRAGGISIMRDGLNHYRDMFRAMTGKIDSLDMGLMLYAIKTMTAPMKETMPEVSATEELCDHLFKPIVLTVPIMEGEQK